MNTIENVSTQGSRPSSLSGLLRGKVAIITGASRGIGAAAARAFAEAGVTRRRFPDQTSGWSSSSRHWGQRSGTVERGYVWPVELVRRPARVSARLLAQCCPR
jgi:hypothetical protein